MNSRKQQELEENLRFVRERLPKDQPALPPGLSSEILLQKAKLSPKRSSTYRPFRWQKAAAMACALVLVAVLGVYSLWTDPKSLSREAPEAAYNTASDIESSTESDTAAPSAAQFAVSPQTASSESGTAGAYSTSVESYPATAESRELFRQRYPEMSDADIYTLVEGGSTYLVIRNDYGDCCRSIAVLGNEMEEGEGETLRIRDKDSGRELSFDPYSLAPLS